MPVYFLHARFIKIICAAVLLTAAANAFAQPEITGPQCVLPGTSYQYIVTGRWGPGAVVKVCVTGGRLRGDSVCSPDGKIPFMIFVTWNASGDSREIVLTSDSGNISFPVIATAALSGGQVSETDKVQVYSKDKSTYVFHCKESGGGHCTPNYLYQWQYSDNNVQWKNIEGARDRDLSFTGSVLVNTFFRRVTTETGSSSTAYSDQGMLAVDF